jgi:hypothetical protein
MDLLGGMNFDDILYVDFEKEHGIYEVRVLRMWKVADLSSAGSFNAVEMVFIDKNVSRIVKIFDDF